MPQSGRVAFGNMEAVVFGRPAAAEIAAEARRCGAERVFLMVSGTLNRNTDEIDARMTEEAMNTPWVPRNPRPIVGPEQVREILERAA